MGERKVLNQYYPPDFDPSKVPRAKTVRSEEKQMKVRMMLPMSVRCSTCGNFMYKGTKFNTRMENVKGEDYLGIRIFRFYYKCTNCSAEFCMKTDPKSADYIVEAGATRNYELWKDQQQAEQNYILQKEEEEKGNAIKALENKTLDSKREMEMLNALDEMKSLKARQEAVSTEAALAALKEAAAKEAAEVYVDEEAEDEEQVRQMLLQRAGFIKRLPSSSSESKESEDKGEESVVNAPKLSYDAHLKDDRKAGGFDGDRDNMLERGSWASKRDIHKSHELSDLESDACILGTRTRNKKRLRSAAAEALEEEEQLVGVDQSKIYNLREEYQVQEGRAPAPRSTETGKTSVAPNQMSSDPGVATEVEQPHSNGEISKQKHRRTSIQEKPTSILSKDELNKNHASSTSILPSFRKGKSSLAHVRVLKKDPEGSEKVDDASALLNLTAYGSDSD